MSESKLQSDIVRKFSELYPNKRGQLFHVPNERNNKKQAYIARSIGIFPGVADLLFIDGFSHELIIVGMELKEVGSYHKVDHVKQQLEWGRILESQGGVWRLCTSVEQAIKCTEHNYQGLTVDQVETMLINNGNKKNIKF